MWPTPFYKQRNWDSETWNNLPKSHSTHRDSFIHSDRNPTQTRREAIGSWNWEDQDRSTRQDLDRNVGMKSRIYSRDKMKIRLRFEYSGKTKAGMRLPETYKAFLKTHCGLFPRTKLLNRLLCGRRRTAPSPKWHFSPRTFYKGLKGKL